MSLRAWDTVTGKLITLSGTADSADDLPAGTTVNARYACDMCGQIVSLSRRSGPDSSYTPRFAHGQKKQAGTDEDGCPARADIQKQVTDDVQVVIDLGEDLIRALPGMAICVEYPGPLRPGEPAEPPVVVCRPGDGPTVVIDRPRGPLTIDRTRRRMDLVRRRYGASVLHFWFFADDPVHFREIRPKQVKPVGAATPVRHRRVRPTNQQLAIVAAGGHVCWLQHDQTVLVPYGGREFWHAPDPRREDWSGPMAGSRKDWEISHPQPDPNAHWWGLVPIALSSLGGTKVAFAPQDAYRVMEGLEAAQERRWASLRRRAREQYNQNRALAERPPSSPLPPPAEDPLPLTSASTTESEAQVVEPSTPSVTPPPRPAPLAPAAVPEPVVGETEPSSSPGPAVPSPPAPSTAPVEVQTRVPPRPLVPPVVPPPRSARQPVLRRVLGSLWPFRRRPKL
ncbi:hypothetical protein ACWEQ8_27565 [Streptomyces noursei]